MPWLQPWKFRCIQHVTGVPLASNIIRFGAGSNLNTGANFTVRSCKQFDCYLGDMKPHAYYTTMHLRVLNTESTCANAAEWERVVLSVFGRQICSHASFYAHSYMPVLSNCVQATVNLRECPDAFIHHVNFTHTHNARPVHGALTYVDMCAS
jgi:hypothetical protein